MKVSNKFIINNFGILHFLLYKLMFGKNKLKVRE